MCGGGGGGGEVLRYSAHCGSVRLAAPLAGSSPGGHWSLLLSSITSRLAVSGPATTNHLQQQTPPRQPREKWNNLLKLPLSLRENVLPSVGNFMMVVYWCVEAARTVLSSYDPTPHSLLPGLINIDLVYAQAQFIFSPSPWQTHSACLLHFIASSEKPNSSSCFCLH